jgi:hypothetical protein
MELYHCEFHYHVHNNLILVPIQSRTNPIYTLLSYYLKIHFKIIFPCTPRSSTCLLPLGFLLGLCNYFFLVSHACYVSLSSHPP